jgi:energy-coupling factor transport system ATP-binding protein
LEQQAGVIVRFRGVNFRYPGSSRQVLSNINLELGRGDFTVVTGNNSSGKTTLGKCINALVPYSSGGYFDGTVEVCGLNTLETSTVELSSRVGLIFSNPEDQLITSTVKSELSFGLENRLSSRAEITARVERILRELDITGLADSSVFTLSTGQMQLVAIAAFAVMQPDILVLDDPLSHLNRNVAKTVIRTIAGLHEKKTTIVWITQDVTEVLHLADRVVVLDHGEVRFNGPPMKLMDLETTGAMPAVLPQHVELALRLVRQGVEGEIFSPSLDDMIGKLKRALMKRGAR